MIGKATPGGSGFGGGVGRQARPGRHERRRPAATGGRPATDRRRDEVERRNQSRGVAAADAAVEQLDSRTRRPAIRRRKARRRRAPSASGPAPAPPGCRRRRSARPRRRRCRTEIFVAPPAPTDVPSTTNVSERVAAPPSLSTVSSISEPPLEMNVPAPAAPGVCRRAASDHEHVAGDGVALQIDHARVGERRHADQVALQRPAERHCVVGVAEREILPRAVQRRGACHCGERSAFRCW